MKKRVIVLDGDVTLDKFGLTDKKYNLLGNTVDTVIHSAAIVKHYGEYSELENVNVSGTKRIVDFSLRYGIKMNHISTISIFGAYFGERKNNIREYTENDFYVGQDYTENVYVRSKFEAENIVLMAMKKGLNATIFRMGNLTGRYTDGHYQYNIHENYFYNTIKSAIELRVISERLSNVDVEFTPVDYAGKAVVAIARTERSCGRVFHIFNHNKISTKKLLDIFYMIGIGIQVTDSKIFRDYIREVSLDKNKKHLLTGLINDINNNGEMDNKHVIRINSDITCRYLSQLNFEWPEIDIKYIENIIGYMIEVRFIDGNTLSYTKRSYEYV